ncbi:MAG TPA: LytTR family DNA-binding domain-containing protein [Thiobacillaceae bacterium]|nr:LytTR family DNA-binding domain-containing protein [Thiobacillaceae bacterium]
MPAPLRVLLVDDEAPARRRLAEVLSDCAATLPVQIVGETDNGLDALSLLQKLPVDALLLDIRMPGMDGIEVAQHLQKLHRPPAVIFTTAYDTYACQAFEVNAVDYLMKPVRAERLRTALGKAHTLSQVALDALRQAHPKARSHLSLTEKGRMVLIPVDEIVYLKAEAKYVTVRTLAREFLIEESLVRLESEFAEKFVRIHRNCLVARNRIAEIGKLPGGQDAHYLRLSGLNEKLAVSRRQYSNLREALGG